MRRVRTRPFMTTWSRVTTMIGAVTAVTVGSAAAQIGRPLLPGEPVRFTLACEGTNGCQPTPTRATVVEVWADSIALLISEPTVVRYDAMVSLERMAGRRHHARAGAAIGAGVGVVVGLAMSSDIPVEEGGRCGIGQVFCVETRGQARMLGALLGGATGGLLGAFVGLTVRDNVWVPVALPPHRALITP